MTLFLLLLLGVYAVVHMFLFWTALVRMDAEDAPRWLYSIVTAEPAWMGFVFGELLMVIGACGPLLFCSIVFLYIG